MTRSVVFGLAVGLMFLGLTASAATAQTSPIGVLVDQILSLFPKVDGDVLEVQDGSVTLSLGKKDGLAPGVELSVYREGRELRHPRTGALLGKTEESVGRVRVEQVFEAYATGRVTQATDIKPGDRVRVSAGKVTLTVVPMVEGVKDALAEAAVQALVEDLNRTGRFQIAMGDAMAAALVQEGLSRADILEGKGMAKRAERQKIENALVVLVKTVDKKPFMDVRLFSFPGPSQVLTTGLFVPASVRPAPQGNFSASDKSRPNQTARQPQSLLSRLLTGELDSGAYSTGEGSIPLKEIAKFPFVVLSLDIAVAPADKTPRMVVTDGHKVYLYKIVERVLEPEWTWTGNATASVFGVQLADLDGDGVLEVVVNRYHPNPGILLNSLILGSRDGKPVVLVKDINQTLLAVDATGDGVKRTLWAQDFVQTGFWKAGQVDRVALRDGRLVQEARVAVPSTFRATGATMSNIAGKNAFRALAFVDEHNRLRISMDTEEVWRSASPVGGGASKLGVEMQVGRATRTNIYIHEPNPVAVDLDGDGIEEIVVPQNQVPGRLAVIFKGPAGYRFQSVNSGFEGTISGLGVIPGDPTPSLVVSVTRYYGVLTTAGDTQIIMTIPE
ncbi:MAG: hypothetical protein E6K82_06735 [Candidatus Rokuibacteriota bacterium]|nr:MAG: hypothetical protein E6K82_06735 [Candidatus Rokubacteria bacterium]